MKNIKSLILILSIALVAVSCETYDDYDNDRKPVVGFTVKNKNINNIPAGGSKSTTVDVFASDVSSADRTFSIVVVPIESTEDTPRATEDNYDFDATVTIPADERIGTVTITGENNTLPSDGTRHYFTLAIDSGSDVVGGGTVTIGLKGS
ncbi:MAG TPA: hypothetical protein VKX34_06780 [Aequorivita sp.]|nr:hypothetical protein [Aequorivita sp.]